MSRITLARDKVSEWPPYEWSDVELLLDAHAYVRDLGMPSARSLWRQLRVDVPRCEMRVNGVPTASAWAVRATASHPALCTQAALAPPCEWLLRHGYVACEPTPVDPVRVEASRTGVVVHKRLALRQHADGALLSYVGITLCAEGANLLLTLTHHDSRETAAHAMPSA